MRCRWTCPCRISSYGGELCTIHAGDNYKYAPVECLKKYPTLLEKRRKYEDQWYNSPIAVEARKISAEWRRYGVM